MEIIKVNTKFTLEERETLITYDSVDKTWTMDSFTPKFFRKALKQGWTPIRQYVYEDGTVCGMTLVGPERAITIRNTEKKQMSERQLGNLDGSDDEQLQFELVHIDTLNIFVIIITIQNDWGLISMYGAFWSIYWQYWADRREEDKKKK